MFMGTAAQKFGTPMYPTFGQTFVPSISAPWCLGIQPVKALLRPLSTACTTRGIVSCSVGATWHNLPVGVRIQRKVWFADIVHFICIQTW